MALKEFDKNQEEFFVNKNLSEFENKLPSVLEYDTQQLLDYYYESPEKMKIAEVLFGAMP